MKTKEITENNKLIAEFMGMKPSKIFGKYSISKDHCTCNEDTPDKAMNGFASIAKYNTSWDWLMPIVEEIEKEGFSVYIASGWKRHSGVTKITHVCDITISGFFSKNHEHWSKFGDTKIKAVYLAIIEFVKWYNENKPEFMEDYLNPEDIEDINDSLSK